MGLCLQIMVKNVPGITGIIMLPLQMEKFASIVDLRLGLWQINFVQVMDLNADIRCQLPIVCNKNCFWKIKNESKI